MNIIVLCYDQLTAGQWVKTADVVGANGTAHLEVMHCLTIANYSGPRIKADPKCIYHQE